MAKRSVTYCESITILGAHISEVNISLNDLDIGTA